MSNAINLKSLETFPTINAIGLDGGEVLMTWTCYPGSAQMAIPMEVAVELATNILILANKSQQCEASE
jgi:hypothetical protein